MPLSLRAKSLALIGYNKCADYDDADHNKEQLIKRRDELRSGKWMGADGYGGCHRGESRSYKELIP